MSGYCARGLHADCADTGCGCGCHVLQPTRLWLARRRLAVK